jgi:hypothetical protein
MALLLKYKTLFVFLFVIMLALQGCAPSTMEGTVVVQESSTPGEIPTWTPRPQDLTLTALPTATWPFDQPQGELAPISSVTPVPRTATPTPAIVASPQTVSVTIKGGNLFVRRGPGLEYNYVDVLHDGVTVLATGRDRISRWIRVALPSKPEMNGWITTETNFTIIQGDVPNLPYIETEPARPAFIRNCTDHELLVLPAGVKLLEEFEEPFNEERFPVGIYQIYDLENPENKPIEEVNLSEGETVEIQYDWTGERSKCE